MQPGIGLTVEQHLPSGVVWVGCQGASRRSPHALFALSLVLPPKATAVRHWLAAPFLTNLLPPLLDSVERCVADVVRGVSR